MPLRLDIKRRLTARSDRVKCVDLHPTEPWMLCSLYSGNINVWNHESQQLVKTFEVCDLPVRAAKFVPRKNWVVSGSDDMQIRVFNYNTLDRVHAFEAHSDYVRCVVAHPTQPFILTSSAKKMGLCFAPDCDHTNKTGCKMIRFPADPKLREKWEKLIRRQDRKTTKFSLICSCHFKDGDRNNLPTIFKRNIGKQFAFPQLDSKKRSKTKKDISITASNLQQEVTTGAPSEDEPRPSTSQSFAGAFSYSSGDDSRHRISEGSLCGSASSSSSSLLEAENYFLKRELEQVQEKLKKLQVSFGFAQIEHSNKLISMYTGLPDKSIFMAIFKYLDSQNFNYYFDWTVTNIARIDQFFITLMKLRLNLLHEDLALRFNCSSATISNIVITWIHLMHACLYKQFLENNIPSREKNKMCMPSSFSAFTNCRMVIDCTEIYTEVPSQLDKQKGTYSNYKHRNTLKGLIGVAPNGTITYMSSLYVGSTSDKRIVSHSKILSHFVAGDLILADKGFLIQDLLPSGVSVNIPPFLVNAQFSQEECRQVVAIAKARIHVERAIRRIKKFKILSLIPSKLRPFASVIFQVCGFLTTLNYPLIKEIEDLYLSDHT